ncbi:MAG: hypothetical protein IKO14_00810 [Oscillibacter sp.]|nr:hypothetical protein [Oscillibacter sp.]
MKRKSLLVIGALLCPLLLIALILSGILAWADNNGEALKTIGLVLAVSSCLIFGVFTPLWVQFKSDTETEILRDYGEESFFFVQREQQRKRMVIVRNLWKKIRKPKLKNEKGVDASYETSQ